MKLLSRSGAERRYLVAVFVVAAGFFGTTGHAPIFMAALPVLIALAILRTSGSAASFLELDSQSVTARFSTRRSVSIPLSRIAAVEVHRRWWLTTTGEPMSFITIFRADTPEVIEIIAPNAEAEPFLRELAARSKRRGLKDIAAFAIPRSQYVHDLLPLVPSIAILALYPSRVSWAAFAIAAAAFVLHSALGWSRYATLAKQIADGEPPRDSLAEWTLLVRAS